MNTNDQGQLQLYIHIPFCQEKCAYCDFLSFASCGKEQREYVNALIQEIHLYKEYAKNTQVSSIFMGGGTPSVLSGQNIEEIFRAINDVFAINKNAEISIECNPGTLNMEKLQSYAKAGINRISLGLQATTDKELQNLGRIHNYETFIQTYQMVRESGFTNVNVDLMSAIPGQSVENWKESLEKIVKLQPEHISAYSLIIEEGTKFWNEYGEGMPRENELPSQEDERQMYYDTQNTLKNAGYIKYEVSNYAKEGKACKHNLGYWERKEYLGVGLGAASLIFQEQDKYDVKNKIQKRTTNVNDIKSYIKMCNEKKFPLEEIEVLTNTEQMEEFMFLGLRKSKGISLKEFQITFGDSIEKVYTNELEDLIKKQLLEIKDGHLRLTELGVDLSNMVLSEFIK